MPVIGRQKSAIGKARPMSSLSRQEKFAMLLMPAVVNGVNKKSKKKKRKKKEKKVAFTMTASAEVLELPSGGSASLPPLLGV